MTDRYELRAVFAVEDAKKLVAYAREQHRRIYPPGTKDGPPVPREIADAIVTALIDCKEGAAPEEFGLEYTESVTGPVREAEEAAVEGVRILFARTGGRGPYWEALEKVV